MHQFGATEIETAYRQTTGSLKVQGVEKHGPCPNCGGEDRFWLKLNGAFGCRGCCMKGDVEGFKKIMKALGLSGEKDTTSTYPQTYRANESTPVSEVVSWPDGKPVEEAPQVYGCTVRQYAERTQLPEQWLREGHPKLKDTKHYVKQADGEVDAVFFGYPPNAHHGRGKFRVAIEGKDKYRYKKGSKAGLYGVEWLASEKVETTRRVVVTEGESCAQTCWFHGIAAVGIPGGGVVKVLEEGHLTGLREIYVVQEPDEVGASFPGKVEKRVRELGCNAAVIPLPLPAKDVNELHKQNPDKFHRRFQKAAKAARKKAGLLDWRPTAASVNAPLEPIPWLCWPMLRPGFGLLWAPSFAGKSTMILQLCDAVARGGQALGMLQCVKAGVRFIGYEQGTQADRRRMWAHIGVPPGSHDDVDFLEIDNLPRASEGGLVALDRMLDQEPGVRLVVIDTLARFWDMGKKKTSANAYYQETEALGAIEELTKTHNVCLLGVTHSTASKSKVSGTEAMRGVPRTLIHLDRPDPAKPEGSISVTHNGAPGSHFDMRLVTGSGWQIFDGEFHNKYENANIAGQAGTGW